MHWCFYAVFGIISYVGCAAAGEIHDAASSGDVTAINAAISGGAGVDEFDDSGKTPLYVAAEHQQAGAIRALLANGADPNLSRKTQYVAIRTPFHAAILTGNAETTGLMIGGGADLYLAHYEFGSPLHIALDKEFVEVEMLLRNAGAANYRAPPTRHLIADADIDFGGRVALLCTKCHALKPGDEPTGADSDMPGPPLYELLGRPVGGLDDYGYSIAMSEAGGIWDYDRLNDFLTNPTAAIPGTNMWPELPAERPRAALIAYLRSITTDPPRLE